MKALILTAAAGATAAGAYGVAGGLDRMISRGLSERAPTQSFQTERVDPSVAPPDAVRAMARPDPLPAPPPAADARIAAPAARPSPSQAAEPAPALAVPMSLLPGAYSLPEGGIAALSPLPEMRPGLDASQATRRYEATTMPLIGVYR